MMIWVGSSKERWRTLELPSIDGVATVSLASEFEIRLSGT